MQSIKRFSRYVRQEMNRISLMIKQMEFGLLRIKGLMRRKLRAEINELRRMREAILHKLSLLMTDGQLPHSTMQLIKNEISMLQERCRLLKTQHM